MNRRRCQPIQGDIFRTCRASAFCDWRRHSLLSQLLRRETLGAHTSLYRFILVVSREQQIRGNSGLRVWISACLSHLNGTYSWEATDCRQPTRRERRAVRPQGPSVHCEATLHGLTGHSFRFHCSGIDFSLSGVGLQRPSSPQSALAPGSVPLPRPSFHSALSCSGDGLNFRATEPRGSLQPHLRSQPARCDLQGYLETRSRLRERFARRRSTRASA